MDTCAMNTRFPVAPRRRAAGFWLVVMIASLLALFAGTAGAAAPKDWWVNVTNDRADEVRKQLARGADPNVVDAEGLPSIMLAIREGSWAVYDLLAANKRSNLNIENKFGETPLMYLAVVGETRRAQALIQRGAQVNRLGWTPLQYAASRGHLDTVKMLLSNKAVVNSPGPDGTTALMMAAFNGSEDVVQYLLNNGADITMRTLAKEGAADWARKRGFDALAAKLSAVEQRVLVYQKALRDQASRVTVFGADGNPVSAQTHVNVTSAIPKPSLNLNAPVAAPQASRSDTAGQAASDNGTSRYFDLKRFDQPSAP